MPEVTETADEIAQCGYCTGDVSRTAGPRCDQCAVFHHVDCWNEFTGCVTYGCSNSPDMKKFQGGAI